jgi:hypothetical protein
MLTREAAHRKLTGIAHDLRIERRARSLADAFRLACLLHPDLADLLVVDIDERSVRDLPTDAHASNRVDDDIGVRVRDYARGDNGKTDPSRLRRFAEANSVWQPRYSALNLGGQMAAILGRLRPKAKQGLALAFP